MTLSDLESHFRRVQSLSNIHASGNIARYISWGMGVSIWHRFRDVTNFVVYVTVCGLEKSFSFKKTVEITGHVRYPQFTYKHVVVNTSTKLVTSRKRCQIETLLLQITNRKWHVAYWTVAISTSLPRVTFEVMRLCRPSEMRFFVQLCRLCSSWQDFNRHSASHGLSTITEHLVVRYYTVFQHTLQLWHNCKLNLVLYSV